MRIKCTNIVLWLAQLHSIRGIMWNAAINFRSRPKTRVTCKLRKDLFFCFLRMEWLRNMLDQQATTNYPQRIQSQHIYATVAVSRMFFFSIPSVRVSRNSWTRASLCTTNEFHVCVVYMFENQRFADVYIIRLFILFQNDGKNTRSDLFIFLRSNRLCTVHKFAEWI